MATKILFYCKKNYFRCMILVTGGTGLVGAHLLYHLTTKNDIIRAIYRSKEKIELVKKVFSFYTDDVSHHFSKIEWIQADITDIPSLIPVFDAIDYVYHCAALISFDPKDYLEMRKTNIQGTANIVNFSVDAKVKKLCFVSSIATIGDSIDGNTITEENERNEEIKNYGYSITKFGAEMEVFRGSQEGIDVVVVNPGVILGGGFFNTGSGTLFTKVDNGMPFYTEGITGFVGVEDVVKAMINLVKLPIKNERFILVAENKSFKEIFFAIADGLGKKRPKYKVGKLITSIIWRLDWVFTKITRKKPFLTQQSAKSAHSKTFYSSEKIKKQLDFEFTNIDKVIVKTSKQFIL